MEDPSESAMPWRGLSRFPAPAAVLSPFVSCSSQLGRYVPTTGLDLAQTLLVYPKNVGVCTDSLCNAGVSCKLVGSATHPLQYQKETQHQAFLRHPFLTTSLLIPPLDTHRKHHTPLHVPALVLLACLFDSVVMRPVPAPIPNRAQAYPQYPVST